MTSRQIPCRLAVLTVALFLLVLVTPVPKAAAAQGFNSIYNASSGVFPESVCPPWTLFDSAAPENPALSGGVLVIATDQTAEEIGYAQNALIPDPLVIEARMRLVSGSSTHASRAPAVIRFATAPSIGNAFYIGVDEIFLNTANLVKGPSAVVDTNDALHTYRLEVTAAGVITVFQDGIQKLTGATFFDTSHNDPFPRISFGEISSLAFGVSHWEFIRHNASTVTCPDHFLCYKAKAQEKFEPEVVTLTDQFDTEPQTVEVKKPVSLCNPADKNDEGINDRNTHLKGYQIKPATAHLPMTNIKVRNQFHPEGSELVVDTIKPDRLLVPTAKNLTGPVEAPDPDTHSVDHYKCYKVKGSKGAPKFELILGVSVVDQFNQPKLYDLKKPTRLCNPVEKTHAVTVTPIKNPETHLMCYQAKPAKGEAKHEKVLGIHVNNQFGPERLDTIKEEEFCAPSQKILP
jgi:hypothetical protein